MNLWINQFLLPLESFFSSLTVHFNAGFLYIREAFSKRLGIPEHNISQGLCRAPIRKAETTADYS